MRRSQPQRGPASARPPGGPPPAARPVKPEHAAAAVSPAATRGAGGVTWWVLLVEWVAWIVLWISALGAGYFLGKIDVAKALFMSIMLAITVLPWLRWVRRGSSFRLAPSRIAMLQGTLAIFVAVVLALSGTYWWALSVIVVELALALVILIKAERPAPQTSGSPPS